MVAAKILEKEELMLIKKLDFNVCLQCGRCTSSCPIFPKTGLNTRTLVRKSLYFVSPLTVHPPLDLSDVNKVWDCTTCNTCVVRCPRDVKPMDIIVGLRSILIERGEVPPTIIDALENIYKFGNPFGLSRSKRVEWAKDLNVKRVSEGNKTGLLYFVGCIPSYESRAQEVARSIAITLNSLGIDFSILGEKENCCGNEVYSLGEKGLFEVLVEENTKLFQQYGVNKIITTSPHCFNALKNRYKLNDIEVQHYTQFFADLIDKNKLKFSKSIDKKIAFHDPCYLGKHNNIFDEPRRILENIPGVELVELPHSKSRSICCEGGGGRMWYDPPGEESRLAEDRINEAVELGVDILAVACPFCLLTLEDALKKTGNEDKIQIKDIMEVVRECL